MLAEKLKDKIGSPNTIWNDYWNIAVKSSDGELEKYISHFDELLGRTSLGEEEKLVLRERNAKYQVYNYELELRKSKLSGL